MTEPVRVTPLRDTLLLSHANPEDDDFTSWLALQLANEGYRVWCDLTKLLGGEVLWDEIEEVIKTRAVQVLYVL
jgi:TIR domain